VGCYLPNPEAEQGCVTQLHLPPRVSLLSELENTVLKLNYLNFKVVPCLVRHRERASLFFLFYSDGTGVWTLGFKFTKQALYHLSCTSTPFCSGYFENGVYGTICLSWPRTMILLISTSQVAGITGVNHQCPENPSNIHPMCWGFYGPETLLGVEDSAPNWQLFSCSM
jgi:hypothetical protein